MQQSEQLQTLTLEEAFAHELAKDVKLKGGGTAIDPDTGQPLKPAKAIAMCSIGDENVTFQYADGKTETEPFADVVEMARLYILTDCNGSFETFSEWGLIRAKE